MCSRGETRLSVTNSYYAEIGLFLVQTSIDKVVEAKAKASYDL